MIPASAGKKLTRSKSRHWLFTTNNWTATDLECMTKHMAIFTYLLYGKEKGSETETPHLQGYVVFQNRQYLSGVKKIFPRSHLEMKSRQSTFEQCISYCKKDGDFTETGSMPKSASDRKKRDWDLAFQNAKDAKLEEIPKDLLIRYYHAFKRIEQDNPIKPEDLKERRNVWVQAPSGYGKSTYVRRRWGGAGIYDKSPNKWWTGYKGEDIVLCDDFGPAQCKYLGWYMKRWADTFSFPMETKGGGMQIRPKRIIITSQYSIEECFEDEKVCLAICNRFEVVNLQHWKKRINFI